MTVNINKPQINLREQLKKLERPTTDKLAVKGHDGILLDPLTGDLNLQGIDSVVKGAAVDVFVYDTRKDSDGGTWRKRTQHTSWYNETLNTATRGSRREFPAVAVLVLESTQLTIYDADDPDLPMWMVFNRASNNMLFNGSSSGKKVEALNGHVALANSDALFACSFIDDRGYLVNSSNTYESGNILGRNSGYGYNITSTVNELVSSATNDVAMTVLPNAPIDPSTGLPVPTIAVATNGGVSVVRDDNRVVSYSFTHGVFSSVSWFSDTQLLAGTAHVSGTIGFRQYVIRFPKMSVEAVEGFSNEGFPNWTTGKGSGAGSAVNNFIANKPGNFSIGYNGTAGYSGLNLVHYDSDADCSSVAYITSEYNTGYQHGDIKGAFLSDTDTASNPELVTNGTFNANVDDWNTTSVTIVRDTTIFTNGGIKVTTPGGASYATQQVTGLVSGKQYVFTARAYNPSGNPGTDVATISIVSAGYTPNIASSTTVDNTIQDLSVTFTASGTTETIYLSIVAANYSVYGQNGSIGYFDNVSVRLAEEDRSVNNKGLAVYGTITKSAVATGADLVAYGPFNNSNNFRQPYNSNLSFGTGDFSIMFWVYDTGVNQHCTLISRDEREFDISRLGASFGSKLRIYTRNSSEDLRAPDSASALPFNKWVCVCVTYTGGNTKNVYIDGKLDNTITGTNGEYDIDSTTYGLNIGVRYTGGTKNYSADGVQLALVRLSASAPSPEQVKKIYEDEKVLFQENAKATLYGSSDSVIALAYDDGTSLLHVGTPDGRSTFSGLKRVENTTTAVTSAISASNGLVAER